MNIIIPSYKLKMALKREMGYEVSPDADYKFHLRQEKSRFDCSVSRVQARVPSSRFKARDSPAGG